MQPVDFTTLIAACSELRHHWLPARLEQVYQRDRYTIALALRTLESRGWLTICWHPQGARICIGDSPPRTPDTFTFSDQLRHQLKGFALTKIAVIAPWERVVDLQFAKRPGEEPLWHLYVEIIGKYSNVILTDAKNLIVTVAHQVNQQQSSVRTIQTGQPYEFPPVLTGTFPNLKESQASWYDRVNLVPGTLKSQMMKSYCGLSPRVTQSMIKVAGLDPQQSNQSLQPSDWQILFKYWQQWLQSLEEEKFTQGWTEDGYTVLGWQIIKPSENVQNLLNCYYTNALNQQVFQQLRHQLTQKIANLLRKLNQKAQTFQQRLAQSQEADKHRCQGDLLMAHLHQWEPGMNFIKLIDFTTGKPVKIPLNPEKNAVQNAQLLYKRHQKLKRARHAVEPLLKEVNGEIAYLEQVEDSLKQLSRYHNSQDLKTLEEIREELIEQKYFAPKQYLGKSKDNSQPHSYVSPSGHEILIGRNNRQNDILTFRTAVDYDLWFHTQEIPGSHVLLRLQPGAVAEETDLQFTANLATYYSRARNSDSAPVVYTEPKNVYKPKGAKPGMAIYKQERIIWGHPQEAISYLKEDS